VQRYFRHGRDDLDDDQVAGLLDNIKRIAKRRSLRSKDWKGAFTTARDSADPVSVATWLRQ
jgi:hypothetical protein